MATFLASALMRFLPPPNDLVLFITAAVVLLLIPGPAVLHVVARSVDQGRRAALASSAGIATGHTFWPQRLGSQPCWSPSAAAYSVVKCAGAAYLFRRKENKKMLP